MLKLNIRKEMMQVKRILKGLLLLLFSLILVSCELDDINDLIPEGPIIEPEPSEPEEKEDDRDPSDFDIYIDEFYITKDEVAMYIYFFEKLPDNYVKKEEIKGHIRNHWTEENMLSIGGDDFYNRERLLPSKNGRNYYEADILYMGEYSRNSLRIVFSNDGLIFYTSDHYGSFIQFNTEDFTWIS